MFSQPHTQLQTIQKFLDLTIVSDYVQSENTVYLTITSPASDVLSSSYSATNNPEMPWSDCCFWLCTVGEYCISYHDFPSIRCSLNLILSYKQSRNSFIWLLFLIMYSRRILYILPWFPQHQMFSQPHTQLQTIQKCLDLTVVSDHVLSEHSV